MISLGHKKFPLSIPCLAWRLIAALSLLESECSFGPAAAADVHELEPSEEVRHLGLAVVAGPQLGEWEEREKVMIFLVSILGQHRLVMIVHCAGVIFFNHSALFGYHVAVCLATAEQES